jgi:hypothetical protein
MSWQKITCEEREALVDRYGRSYNGLADPYGVIASRSDLGGEFGDPEVFTEWGHKETDLPVLRDIRYPAVDMAGTDLKPCEHYAFEGDGW